MSFSRLIQPFGKNPKSINEIIFALKNELTGNIRVERTPIEWLISKIFPYDPHKNIYHLLKLLREMIYGSIQSESEPEAIKSQICNELQKTDLLLILIEKLPNIAFDGRKDIALIYEFAIQQQIGTRFPIVQYIVSERASILIEKLVQFYSEQQFVTICGQIIREFLRFEVLTEKFFKLKDNNNQKFYLKFMDLLKSDSFVVCADVFSTLHELFSHHKKLAGDVLKADYELFFAKINELLTNDSYYVQRKTIKLLSEILMDRYHMTVMKKYVNESKNMSIIKKIMETDCLPNSSFDAFLVFYLFVLNPTKSSSVKESLKQNKSQLTEFIENFQKDTQNVKQYSNEKEKMIETINQLN